MCKNRCNIAVIAKRPAKYCILTVFRRPFAPLAPILLILKVQHFQPDADRPFPIESPCYNYDKAYGTLGEGHALTASE